MTRILLPLFLICLIFSASPARSEDKNALDYLPPDNFISGWEATGNEVFAHAEDLGYLLGASVDLLTEFNAVWYASETYSNFEKRMVIEIYEFDSAADAYGYYQLSNVNNIPAPTTPGVEVVRYGLPPDTQFDTIRSIGNSFLEGWKDRFYFRVKMEDNQFPDQLLNVAIYLLGSFPGSSIPPDIIGILPQDDLVVGTERFIHGPTGLSMLLGWSGDDIFGFDEYTWEAAGGEYRLGGGEYYLLVGVKYDEEGAADSAVESMQEHFQDDGWQTVIVPSMSSGAHPRAFQKDFCMAFWSHDNMLWLVWDVSSQEKLLDALHQQDS
jgi:hypothetical protein